MGLNGLGFDCGLLALLEATKGGGIFFGLFD